MPYPSLFYIFYTKKQFHSKLFAVIGKLLTKNINYFQFLFCRLKIKTNFKLTNQ